MKDLGAHGPQASPFVEIAGLATTSISDETEPHAPFPAHPDANALQVVTGDGAAPA